MHTILIFIYLLMWLYVYLCMYVDRVHSGAHGGLKKTSGPLELE